ncbi:hypothetical protein HS088_TW16G00798 [Tripterygium wilfordii]|uniref:Trehalase n=1 Tax=Tripterygium wilfordii TaxID=458696 RepID=A0A7J7CJX4_TRIWF|nr:hypothetical protein HS088_TW16G00798 [Tripterygium wilfordii]
MAYYHEKKPVFVFLFSLFLSIMDVTNAFSSCNTREIGAVVPTTPLLKFLVRDQETALNTFGGKNFDPKLYVDFSLKLNLSKTESAFDELPRSAGGVLASGEEPDSEVMGVGGSLSLEEFEQESPWFREVYYWDSYWVIRGLLASKIYDTAKAIVNNLILLIDKYGYVLNGARAYYINRRCFIFIACWSFFCIEPPLLSAMVSEVYKRTLDMEFAKSSLPALLKEYQFWNSDIHKVIVHDVQASCDHTLNRYYAMWNKPRPESSTLDKHSASNISNDLERQKFFREIASTAESGWDFSTRWMRNHSDFTDNFYYVNFTSGLKCVHTQVEVSKQNQNVCASNFAPLWIESFYSDASLVEKVMRSLGSSGLVCHAGIATSLTRSGEQWDFPNGWAPLQHMIVEGLAKSGLKEARSMAQEIAISWIRTNYGAYKKKGVMHEKYDVKKCGEYGGGGGGGEYTPQTGFGWSNGAILAFLEEFGWSRDLPVDCQ